jgi:hypothetical protein
MNRRIRVAARSFEIGWHDLEPEIPARDPGEQDLRQDAHRR